MKPIDKYVVVMGQINVSLGRENVKKDAVMRSSQTESNLMLQSSDL